MSKLKACGRVDLDGTHRAIIETDLPEFEHLLTVRANQPRFLKLQNSDTVCGCILAEIRYGGSNRIYLDRFKQRHLQIRDEEQVEVEETQPAVAKKVELHVPSDFSERDTIRFIGKPVVRSEKTALYTISGEPRLFSTGNIEPTGIVIITTTTDIVTSEMKVDEEAEEKKKIVRWTGIGGLRREIRLIREVVEYPLRFPEVFLRLGVSQPKGVILYGPPGTGKTLIARALANEVDAKFYQISGPEIFSMWYGESEKRLREIFDEAQKNAPSVILIDELDSLAPKREATNGEVERRVVATLLARMDGLKELKGVIVVGTTNRINSIDPALRREGRFGHEVHIGVPDAIGRKEILEIHSGRMPLSSDVNLDLIAEKTVGFVGADIASLCREAAYNTLRRSYPPEAFEKGQITPHEDLKVNQVDFDKAIQSTPPSAMKELLIEIPKVSWEDIGGLDDVKRILIENIVYPITKRDVFRIVGVRPARGVLLYGPPGTGKTLLAKAVTSQCGANFIAVRGPEIRSKWVGESEERIRFLFSKAREVAPCVIFFDEIDAVASARGRDSSGVTDVIVNQILSEMDGIESAEGVFVIGATNRAELLDPALLRPGRFDYQIEIPLPDESARKEIFKVHLRGKPVAQELDLQELVKLSEGSSGAEIAEVCREATWDAIRDADWEAEKVKLTMGHITKALASTKQRKIGKQDTYYIK
jgi:transitional endoplasmic reticulum ATPase